MSRALLDVNVLVALSDEQHIYHARARAWLEANIASGWASCAITQNGCARVLSQKRYQNPVATTDAIAILSRATNTRHHEYWPCDITLTDNTWIRPAMVLGPQQLTDVYLLALAVSHRGRFVSLDRRIPLAAVPQATPASLVVL